MSTTPGRGDRDDAPDDEQQGADFRPTQPSEQDHEETEENQGDDAGSGGS